MEIKLTQIRAIINKYGIPQSTLYRWRNAKPDDWRNKHLRCLAGMLTQKELKESVQQRGKK